MTSSIESGLPFHLKEKLLCQDLLERYTYAIDWMDWAAMEKLFWHDATFDFGMWQGDRTGFLRWVSELERGYQRRLHLFAMPRIAIGEQSGKAEAGAVMFFRVRNEAGATHDEMMFGRYLFDLDKRDSEWRLSNLTFLMNGRHEFDALDEGGLPFFADNIDPSHPKFRTY
jgi:hypothetical protein